MNPLGNEHDQVVIAGDWHGNTLWAVNQIQHIAQEYPDIRLIVHLGDFGVWPGSSYIRDVSLELKKHDITLVFVDGNHEWHDELDEWHIAVPGPVAIDRWERIWHLPRGTRWTWHGKKWLAVGGAGSPDAPARVHGVSWWPQEIISDRQMHEICDSGPADVLVSHDCPADLMPDQRLMPQIPSWWDMNPCYTSSGRLQEIVNATHPGRVFHGHLHLHRDHTVNGIHVTGLDMDGEQGNWTVIDTRTLERS